MNKEIFLIKVICPIFFVINSLLYAQENGRPQYLGLVDGKISSQKGVWRLRHEYEFAKAQHNKLLRWKIGVTYGLTESLGIEFFLPIHLKNIVDENSSKGIGDCAAEVQWTFFNQNENIASFQGGVKLPTGNTSANPRLGSGTYDATLEFLAIHSSDQWFFSFDVNSRITTERKGKKYGNFVAYELMFGKTLTINKQENHIINFNLNVSGLYAQQDKMNAIIDENSGGNVILFGPLISYSYKNLLVECLFQVPIAQNLFGNQPRIDLATSFSWTLKF